MDLGIEEPSSFFLSGRHLPITPASRGPAPNSNPFHPCLQSTYEASSIHRGWSQGRGTGREGPASAGPGHKHPISCLALSHDTSRGLPLVHLGVWVALPAGAGLA